MRVIKRDGTETEVEFDEITRKIKKYLKKSLKLYLKKKKSQTLFEVIKKF